MYQTLNANIFVVQFFHMFYLFNYFNFYNYNSLNCYDKVFPSSKLNNLSSFQTFEHTFLCLFFTYVLDFFFSSYFLLSFYYEEEEEEHNTFCPFPTSKFSLVFLDKDLGERKREREREREFYYSISSFKFCCLSPSLSRKLPFSCQLNRSLFILLIPKFHFRG